MKRFALPLLLLAAGCGGESTELADEPDLSEPAAMMLRLSDLPEGFRYGNDNECGDVGSSEGEAPDLDEFLVETRPRACRSEFAREWGGPPRSVQTALLLFETFDDAERAWELRKPLFENFARILITTERGHGEAIAFDSDGLQQFGAGEAWRDGLLVVAVYEEGLSGDDGRDFAAELAARQRERIDSPSDPTEEDDREIGLDDPAIAIPVYWLGREFEPSGLPTLKLYRGERVSGGPEVKIEYDGGVTLELWKPVSRRRFGRRVVHYDEVDVVIKVGSGGPYDSREGIDAVVRGLRRR